jgi:hypothetical protein
VSWRLIALIAVPTAMGLALASLQVSMAERNAQTMGRVERLTILGQQLTGHIWRPGTRSRWSCNRRPAVGPSPRCAYLRR